MLVKSSAHLNQDFLLASLEEKGKLWKWSSAVHTQPCYKLAPLAEGDHRKFMNLMCETFDQHCKLLASYQEQVVRNILAPYQSVLMWHYVSYM